MPRGLVPRIIYYYKNFNHTNYATPFDFFFIQIQGKTFHDICIIILHDMFWTNRTRIGCILPFCGNTNDASNNGNNATVNGASLVNDRFDNPESAFMFDGINDFLEIENSQSL